MPNTKIDPVLSSLIDNFRSYQDLPNQLDKRLIYRLSKFLSVRPSLEQNSFELSPTCRTTTKACYFVRLKILNKKYIVDLHLTATND